MNINKFRKFNSESDQIGFEIIDELQSNNSAKNKLKNILKIILTLPYVSPDQKGCVTVFCKEIEKKIHVSNNLTELKDDNSLPYGHNHELECLNNTSGQCSCLLALESKQGTFISGKESATAKTIHYSHYIVPIVFRKEICGVMNIFLEPTHVKNDEEMLFLRNMAEIISIICNQMIKTYKTTSPLLQTSLKKGKKVTSFFKSPLSGTSDLNWNKKNLDFLEKIPHSGFCIHQNGKIIFTNYYVRHKLDYYDSKEMIGKELSDFIRPQDLAEVTRSIDALLKGLKEPEICQRVFLDRHGNEILAETFPNVIRINNAPAILITVKAINETLIHHSTKYSRSRLFDDLLNCQMQLSQTKNIESAYRIIIKTLMLENKNCNVAITRFQDRQLKLEASHLAHHELESIVCYSPWPINELTAKPVYFTNKNLPTIKKTFIEGALRNKFNTIIFIPLIGEETLIGQVVLLVDKDVGVSSEDIQFAQILSSYLATTIPRLKLMEHMAKQTLSLKFLKRELQQRNRSLERVADRVEVISKSKELFFAMMSHEIRTPLNGILGLAELLSETKLSKKQKEHLALIDKSGQNLLRVINDILDFSKIEANKLTLHNADISLQDLIHDTVSLYSSMAKKKNIKLIVTCKSTSSCNIQADRFRLQQILNNLLHNAIKFTESGTITIEVLQQNEVESKRSYRFSVKDSGIGMSQEEIKHLFKEFSQVESHHVLINQGSGLGLAICSKLLELMNSTLHVKSTLNEGTTFWFDLVFKKGKKPDNLPEEAHIVSTSKRSERILIVEDVFINQIVVTEMLKKFNFSKIDIASNGVEAVKLSSKKVYDLILMDIQMPQLNGYDATLQICQNIKSKNQKQMPIIALTAHSSESEKTKIFESNMIDLLVKPISLSSLSKIIEKYLPSRKEEA